MRIELIDNFRALAMLYVLFCHCLYWADLFFADIKSLFLIAISSFFTISGMSCYFARTGNLKRFYISRLRRILIPYWICAAIFIVINLLTFHFKLLPLMRSEPANIIDIILSWLNPFATQINFTPYLDLAVWFIPVYLGVCLVMPLLKYLFVNLNGPLKILPPIVLIAINISASTVVKLPNEIQSPLYYAIWLYFGLWYISELHDKSVRQKLLPCLSISIPSAIILTYLYVQQIFTLDMQVNKFPPNVMFLLYNAFWIPIIYIFSQQINNFLIFTCKFKLWAWIFQQFKDNCYTIFLYQPISFIAAYIILRNWLVLEQFFILHEFIGIIIYLITAIIISAILGKFFGRFENLK